MANDLTALRAVTKAPLHRDAEQRFSPGVQGGYAQRAGPRALERTALDRVTRRFLLALCMTFFVGAAVPESAYAQAAFGVTVAPSKNPEHLAALQKAGVDLSFIMRSAVAAELNRRPEVLQKFRNEGYRMQIQVSDEGLQKSGVGGIERFSAQLMGAFRVTGRSGQPVAEGGLIGGMGPCPIGDCVQLHTADELRANPALLANQYRAVAADIASRAFALF